jgi:hypothetical protein
MLYCHETTSEQCVIEDAIFGRIDDIGDMFSVAVHEEFISNNLKNCQKLVLPEYSYIYILVAHSPQNPVDPGHLNWQNILSSDQYALLEKNKAYVIGWLLLSAKHPKDVYLIDFADSMVRGYNIVDCMIKRLENEIVELECQSKGCMKMKPKCVLPKQVFQNCVEYWKKYLSRRYGIQDTRGLVSVKSSLKIENFIHWEFLEESFSLKKCLKN